MMTVARPKQVLARSWLMVIRELAVWLLTGLAFAALASVLLGAAVGVIERARIDGIAWSAYGGAITYLGALFTYLYFAFPLIGLSATFWAFLACRVPAIERSNAAMIMGLSIVSAALAVVVRMISAKPPIWCTLAVLFAYLILPRLAIRRIRPGVFSGPERERFSGRG